MKVGWIGVGRMGNPLAGHVLAGGHSLTVHDLRREAATNLLEGGAQWSESPAACAAGQDVVMVCLPMPRDVDAACFGEGGIAEGIRQGTVVIDCSTNSVSMVKSLHSKFAEKGIMFMDSPVSGGVRGARSRDLCVMASGDEATFKRIRPVLDAMGDKVMYCGPIGNGTICKLSHQLFGALLGQSTMEVLTLGVKAGVPMKTLVEAISRSAAGKNPPLQGFKGQQFTNSYEPDELTFTLALSRKDIRLANELGREVDVPMPLANVAEQTMIEAMNRGWGRKKAEVVRAIQQERAGVDLSKG